MNKITNLFLSVFCLFASFTSLMAEKPFTQQDDALKNAKIEELKLRVTKELPSLKGWCSIEKALEFMDLVLETNPKVCVEIGVFGGSSLFPVASALKYLDHGTVIGIDPWDKLESMQYFDPEKDKLHLEWWSKINLEQIFKQYLSTLKKFGLLDYCLNLRTTSEKAAPAIGIIDILHIDGNHSEVCFTQDVMLYLPKVRQGGFIWLNDALSSEAKEAIELLSNACERIKTIDNGNCILFQKL